MSQNYLNYRFMFGIKRSKRFRNRGICASHVFMTRAVCKWQTKTFIEKKIKYENEYFTHGFH